jgi:hypothetical protein
MEDKKNEIQVQNYVDTVSDMVISNPKTLKEAGLLKKQISNLKTLITSSTELEYREAKEAYDDARKGIEDKKKAFEKIQNTRLSLTKPLTAAYKNIKSKIDNYNAELKHIEEEKARKAKEEEERLARERKEREAAEEHARINEAERVKKNVQEAAQLVKDPEASEMRVTKETGVTEKSQCFQHGFYDGDGCPQCPGKVVDADYDKRGQPENSKPIDVTAETKDDQGGGISTKNQPETTDTKEKVDGGISGKKPQYEAVITDINSVMDHWLKRKGTVFSTVFPYHDLVNFKTWMNDLIKNQNLTTQSKFIPGCEIVEVKK